MRLLPFFALLAGCPADEPAPVDETPEAPAPYIFEEDAPPVADLDVGELEAAIDAAVDLALTLNATPIFPAYQAAMVGSESACPSYYEADGNVYWYDQCTAGTGASFSGYSFYQVYENADFGDGALYNGQAVSGVAEVVTADGYTFQSGGSAYILSSATETYTAYTSMIAGAFAWDGPEAEGTWLAEGVSPDVTMVAYNTAYGNFMQLDGGLSGLGGALDTVVFDTVVIYEEALGSTCPTEPGGVVSVRDASGSWYDVVFDGPAGFDAESDPSLCDGCGEAYFRGEPLGSVCADFTTLLAFEGAPW
jgi:hypothetical protein